MGLHRSFVFVAFLFSASSLNPNDINRLRFPSSFISPTLQGNFSVTLRKTGADPGLGTPSDVKGPFHLPPENTPDAFPSRSKACVLAPHCKAEGACASAAASGHSWSGSGLALLLNVTAFSVSAANVAATLLPAAVIDVWQADPEGTYWKDDDYWPTRRRMGAEDAAATEHLYNCRAHGTAGADGVVVFTSLLPGHYVAGSAWRPRHIHLRAQAPGHDTVITQLYFHGDPYLGAADTACSSCKSGLPELVVALALSEGSGTTTGTSSFSLADLESIGVASNVKDKAAADQASADAKAAVDAKVAADAKATADANPSDKGAADAATVAQATADAAKAAANAAAKAAAAAKVVADAEGGYSTKPKDVKVDGAQRGATVPLTAAAVVAVAAVVVVAASIVARV